MNFQKAKGFTLIEIMIVVAIIGIIAAFAYPSYLESIRRSNRADAKVEINELAQRLQRCYTTYSAYNNANCGVANALKDGATVDTENRFYQVTGVVDATTYTLTATPLAGGVQESDTKCTSFVLTNTGVKTATGTDPDICW